MLRLLAFSPKASLKDFFRACEFPKVLCTSQDVQTLRRACRASRKTKSGVAWFWIQFLFLKSSSAGVLAKARCLFFRSRCGIMGKSKKYRSSSSAGQFVAMPGMPGMQMPMMFMPQMQQQLAPQAQTASAVEGQEEESSSESDAEKARYNKKVGCAIARASNYQTQSVLRTFGGG